MNTPIKAPADDAAGTIQNSSHIASTMTATPQPCPVTAYWNRALRPDGSPLTISVEGRDFYIPHRPYIVHPQLVAGNHESYIACDLGKLVDSESFAAKELAGTGFIIASPGSGPVFLEIACKCGASMPQLLRAAARTAPEEFDFTTALETVFSPSEKITKSGIRIDPSRDRDYVGFIIPAREFAVDMIVVVKELHFAALREAARGDQERFGPAVRWNMSDFIVRTLIGDKEASGHPRDIGLRFLALIQMGLPEARRLERVVNETSQRIADAANGQ